LNSLQVDTGTAPQIIPGTAEKYATANVPTAAAGDTAEAVRKALSGRSYESVADIVVLSDGALLGLVRIESLLAADAQAVLGEIMDSDPPMVAPGLDQEAAAWKAVHQGEGSLAVVDARGRFVGLIPPHRLLGVLLQEHDEDLARIGGFLRGTGRAREALVEPVSRRFIHRLPWLLLGLLGALVAAVVVGSFEETLEAQVMIAFFLPGIVYLADAVGTQTEAVVIRGLSAGVSLRQVFLREVITGLLVGAAMALAFIPVGLAGWGSENVIVAVTISLFLACSVATVIAVSLPWAFHGLGIDPAYGSGPLATVVQDMLSIVIYLLISQAIVA
jgi:magnesium transporter